MLNLTQPARQAFQQRLSALDSLHVPLYNEVHDALKTAKQHFAHAPLYTLLSDYLRDFLVAVSCR